jgi:hypothetical protein
MRHRPGLIARQKMPAGPTDPGVGAFATGYAQPDATANLTGCTGCRNTAFHCYNTAYYTGR